MEKAWKLVSKDGKLTPENVKEPLKEIRRALLEADVSLPVVRRFMKRVEEKALGQQVGHGVLWFHDTRLSLNIFGLCKAKVATSVLYILFMLLHHCLFKGDCGYHSSNGSC
jgi:hypothetical protein